MNWNARKGAFLVAIGQTVVLVEHERAVRACINIQRDRVGWFLAGVLQFRAERNDGTGADEQRHRIVGRRGVNGLSARSNRTGPEVVPVAARWRQINIAAARLVGGDGRDEERRTK